MNLPVNFAIALDELYLTYIDPALNTLKEIDSDAMYLKMKPFEKVIRRFYICAQDIVNKNLTIIVSIDGPQKYAYNVKVRVGFNYSDLESFKHSSNSAFCVTSLSENYYDNAVPVDVLIESLNKTETCNILDISLNASENIAL